MKIRDIERFFEELDRRVKKPLQILLTGGAAGILQGVERATLDIDFEMSRRNRGGKEDWESIQKAIQDTARATGITPEYAEDIDRWSAIALPSKSSHLYRKIGKIEVRILDPGLWAIGKLTRYISSDIQDLRDVLKFAKTDARLLTRLWGKALGMSPPSTSQAAFRKQVEAFLDDYAHEIWGPKVDPEELKRVFLQSAQKVKKSRKSP
jgi:hypothetical protein